MMLGKRFTRLLVIGGAPRMRTRDAWLCRCDCGIEKPVRGDHLRGGRTTSCGCRAADIVRARSTTHGHAPRGADSSEHRSWSQMLARCRNPRSTFYRHYGGRGIRVCDRWHAFESFLADMGRRPSPKHSLDRINNNGNYEPGNCRWATWTEQQNNRRSNHRLEIDGETLSVADWARRSGVRGSTISRRLGLGWTPRDAVFTETTR